MSNPIKTITQTSGKDVRLVISDDNWLETSAVDQLVKTVGLPGICCGVGMPDLHPGKGQPIGAAFVSEDMIYPHLVGSDIGCGMGLWKIDTQARKVKLDKWEKKLVGLDEEWDGDVIARLESSGIHPIENFSAFNKKLGTIGGGNHFAEFQIINKIFDTEAFSIIGLEKQSVVLLVHSGSRGLGQAILQKHIDENGAIGLLSSQSEGQNYIALHNYAERWARVNRAVIAERFMQCLSLRGECMLDVSHNTVLPMDEESATVMGYADNNKQCWIHRKGASPIDKGLVMIPGSRGSLSYLVRPKLDDIASLALGGYSLAHGAGRKWKRNDAKGKLENRYRAKDLLKTPFGSRVICEDKNLLFEEAPQAYKNIDLVIRDLLGAGMIEVIASFKPIITYKTRRIST